MKNQRGRTRITLTEMNIEKLVEKLVGQQMGSYIVTRLIGEGGMGFVCEGLLNPYEKLHEDLLSGKASMRPELLRAMFQVRDTDNPTEQDTKRMELRIDELSKQFYEKCRQLKPGELQDAYSKLLEYISPEHQLEDVRRAIKIMNPELILNPKIPSDQRIRNVERFKQEVKFLANFKHPNITRIVESGETQVVHQEATLGKGGEVLKTEEVAIPLHYVVMEYLDLAVQLDKNPLPTIDEAVEVFMGALEGVIYVHSKGVIHRDIKPHNIMYTRDGRVKLGDFGLAKVLEGSSSDMTAKELTASGQMMGTPNFIDPERARGGQATKESDVYCLGATLYHLITGMPHTANSKDKNWMEIVALIGLPTETSTWIRKVKPTVSEELEDLIMKCLAKNPADRPTTQEIREELTRLKKDKLLMYMEPSDDQEAMRYAQIELLRKGAGKWRLGPQKHLNRAEIWTELGHLYAKTPEEVNLRIDSFLNARLEYKAIENYPEVLSPEECSKRIANLDKQLAFETRRLEYFGVKRIVPVKKNYKRAIMAGAAAFTLVSLLGIGGLQYHQSSQRDKRIDNGIAAAELALKSDLYSQARIELDKAWEDAKDLPSSHERVKRISELRAELQNGENFAASSKYYVSMEASFGKREFNQARSSLKEASSLESKITSPAHKRKIDENKLAVAGRLYNTAQIWLGEKKFSDVSGSLELVKELLMGVSDSLKQKRDELQEKVKKDEQRITLYIADIKMFEGLMELYTKAVADYSKIETQLGDNKFPRPAEITSISDSFEQLSAKLLRVDPEAIGKDVYDEKYKAVSASQKSVPQLREKANNALYAYFSARANDLDVLLANIVDHTQPNVPDMLKKALDLVKLVEADYDKVDASSESLVFVQRRLSSYGVVARELDSSVKRYQSWLKIAQEGSGDDKRNAQVGLVKTYIGVRRLDDAQKSLDSIQDKLGLDVYVQILDLERKTADPQAESRNELLKALSELYKSAGYDKLSQFTLSRVQD
jgi:serine/threonine protein kinase